MESATRIPLEQTSGASKSVFVPWNLVKDDVLYFSTFKMCVCVCVLGPGVVAGVQGTYPYVVWNPPEQPNGVITGYRLRFTRSGSSRSIVTNSDQTFYIIQPSDIPWTIGSFTVSVSL